MNQQQFFERVIETLERLQVPYMVTGSVAAMLYGEPRMTNDLDVVVCLTRSAAVALLAAFAPDDYYAPPIEVVQEEMSRAGQFNVIHVESGAKVDFVIIKTTEFARTEFARRIKVEFSDRLQAAAASPEDIIISKLLYYQMGSSDKHLRDIRGILAVSGGVLDREYINGWTRKLGVSQPWADCQVQP